jgi:D-alanyl-D-alanine carboxypeptidase/D-alanyl-D-alanine-endopeptidase (penicillin-binding protein 4)
MDRARCAHALSLVALICALGASTWLHADSLRDVQNRVASILAHPALHSAVVGFEAASLTRGDCLMSVDAERALLPASNMKLLTAATALELLGPDYRYHTRLVAARRPADGVVPGDLTLVAAADPTAQGVAPGLASRLVRSGVTRIEGGIIATGPTTELAQNQQPSLAAAGQLHRLLGDLGIAAVGGPSIGEPPGSAVVLAERTSPPVREIIKAILKPSDNDLAERLLCSLPWAAGRPELEPLELIGEAWGERGLYLRPVRLADGSGLSRKNLLTPHFLVRLLRYMYEQSQWPAPFAEALPIAGVDGTLVRRMRATCAQGHVRAKTGTLTGVSSLSGYVQPGGSEKLAFSVMMNGFTCDVARVRRMQDQVCVALAELDRSRDGRK